jgi:hypothetical protein
MALQLERTMRNRLRQAGVFRSPERVLEKLAFQRTVEATAGNKKIQGLVAPTREQLTFYDALEVAPPRHADMGPL